MNYDVTVVTVVYELVKCGRRDMFRQCVDSVSRQEGVRIEHIVVDGGSTDGTKELILALARGRENFSWISEPDKGIYDAMNKGLGLANGRYIAFVNADDYYHRPDGLVESVRALDSSKADFSYAPVRIIKRDGSYSEKHPHIRPDLRNLLKGMPFSHQGMLVSTDLMRSLGGFSRSYARSADYALVMEMIFAGRRAVSVEKDFATFRLGGFSGQNFSENLREHKEAFAELSRRYLGRGLTEKEFNAYVYACVLRTFGASALRRGWHGIEATIAASMSDVFRENAGLRREVRRLKRSESYRVGMAITWPARKACRGLKCLLENGPRHAARLFIGKCLRKFNSRLKW